MRLEPLGVALIASTLCACASSPDRVVVVIPDRAPPPTVASSSPARALGDADLFEQRTPLEAARSFVRAFRAERWDVLMRFIPSDHVHEITPAKLEHQFGKGGDPTTRARIESLDEDLRKDRLNVELIGDDRAVAPYGAGGTLQLFKENAAWKVQDF